MKRIPALKFQRGGFSLVEAVLSLGIMSFGFLALAPLLAVGLNGARVAQNNRTMAQIAATFIEEAKQGTLAPGIVYLDDSSNPCGAAQAVYVVQDGMAACDGNGLSAGAPLTRLTLKVSPRDAPNTVRIYADVFPTPTP